MERVQTIDREHQKLSCEPAMPEIAVSRSTVYYRPLAENAQTLALMRRIDELYLDRPFYGSRQNDASPGARGGGGRSAPGAAVDADAGGWRRSTANRGLPWRTRRAACIPICYKESRSYHRTLESGVVRGHLHLYSGAGWVLLLGGGDGLCEPARPGTAAE